MWTAEQREKYKDDGRRYPSDLTDAEWATIQPVLSCYGTLTAELREMVNACLYLNKTGCGWRYLPKDFGSWNTVRTWHDRFQADGVWASIAGQLTRAVRQKSGRPAEPATAILDSQSVVSGPQKGRRGVDGNKRLKGIKRHVLACALGFVLGVLVTAANVHDTAAAGPLLDRVAQDGWRLERQGRRDLHWCTDGSGSRAPGCRRAGLDPGAGWVWVHTSAAALAHRGDLWHAHEPLSPPHPQSGAERRRSRECCRNRQLPPRVESLHSRRTLHRLVKQALSL